jgi:hypothetical protein
MTNFNTNDGISELKIGDLDGIVGGTNWGNVGLAIRVANQAVGFAMLGGAGFAEAAIVLQTKQ